MVKRLLENDRNGDGKLNKTELPAYVQERFGEFDRSKDGLLDVEEIRKMAQRLVERPRLPPLSTDAAWERLPGAAGARPPLPEWARALAGPLPLTTARMLEADSLHRTGDRLDARLRGLIRWAAADSNGCAYGKAMAAADLRRAGSSDADLQTLAATPHRLPTADRMAVAFARKMMREAYAVTDDEVKQLVEVFGEARVVAMVALLAHASFQDRIFLALNVQPEPEGPLPPLTAVFAQPRPGPPSPAHAASAAKPETKPETKPRVVDGEPARAPWLALQESLAKQRARTERIRVPSREEVLRRIGRDHPGAWQTDILWSRVCYAHQPELTDAWFACVGAFRQEAALDRVFEQCVFWVITESLQCYY
jgi:alkylhydroperoxidase family enzyme